MASNDSHIATTLSINGSTVLNWRAHFFANGLDSVREVRTGRERKPEISLHLVQAIVHATPHETPPGATQLVGCRSTAKVAGVSHATVRRI